MAKPLKDIPIVGRPTWRDIADSAVRKIKELTGKGSGVDGAFGAYTRAYSRRKSKGGFPHQASMSTTPDLKLTGDMMRDLKTTSVGETFAVISWPSQGEKVRWNTAQGRAVSTLDKPLAKSVANYIFRRIDKAIKRNIKQARVHKTFRFGKR